MTNTCPAHTNASSPFAQQLLVHHQADGGGGGRDGQWEGGLLLLLHLHHSLSLQGRQTEIAMVTVEAEKVNLKS